MIRKKEKNRWSDGDIEETVKYVKSWALSLIKRQHHKAINLDEVLKHLESYKELQNDKRSVATEAQSIDSPLPPKSPIK